jgi:hypothetical protein
MDAFPLMSFCFMPGSFPRQLTVFLSLQAILCSASNITIVDEFLIGLETFGLVFSSMGFCKMYGSTF